MSYRTKNNVVRWFVYILLITIFYSIQTTPNFLEINGVRANFIISLGFFLGVSRGYYDTIFLGALVGMFSDFNGHNIMGFSSLLLMLLYFISVYIQNKYLKNKFFNIYLLFIAIFSIYHFVSLFFYYFIWYQTSIGLFLFDNLIYFIYTLVASFIMYRLSLKVDKRFKREEGLDV
ncbi:MAG: hypothetical protein ACRCZK_01305 [Oscillospiraceae bacterium]